jgi:hypothetical protein
MAPAALRHRLSTIALALTLGAGLGLSVTIGLIVWLMPQDDTVPLTAENLEKAQRLWQAHGPDSYDLDLAIGGLRAGTVHIEVRHGQVTAMTRDGRSPSQRRTWDAWAVPGQFDTLEIEWAGLAHPERGFAAPPGAQVIERVRFDPELGFPQRYVRQVLGTELGVEWTTTSFKLVADEPPAVKK